MNAVDDDALAWAHFSSPDVASKLVPTETFVEPKPGINMSGLHVRLYSGMASH